MDLHRLGRAAVFVAGSIIGGLALAFIIVFVHPQLLQRPAAPPPDRTGGPTSAAAPRVASSAATSEAAASAAPAADTGATTASPLRPAPALAAESYAAAVRRAAPAVVNISTARLVTEQIEPSALAQLFGDLRPLYRRRVERALGSGVIVDASGHIITNNHVIANADTIMITLADGRVARAVVVGRDPDTDLALLSIKLNKLPVMPFGRSDQLQVGDGVLAIGNPLGLSQTVTHGIVSATGRSQLGVATFEDFIQTDAAINAGNSGGALINTLGDLIGINTAVLGKNSSGDISVEGISFAIPVNLARGVMEEILDHGRVIRGWTGLVPEDVGDEQAQQLGLARGGVVITNLYRNSPAVDAGLRIGDILTKVDGKSVHSAQEALAQIAAKKPGSHVQLHLLRGHTELDANLAVTERPQAS
ncbi:MAG TPA: trypsin-like peptidase domain-containing protein [Steroidobacteraceae bacterium]|nr:trypsin-like peptidase domain-containing protein [Steroidobacteraceae bacterium]